MAGARDAEVMAQIEHATDKEAKIYRRQAERRSLTGNGQAKIDNVIDLRAKRRSQNQGRVCVCRRPCNRAANGALERELSNGAPERIRTSDPQIRSLMLYPAELRARISASRRLRVWPDAADVAARFRLGNPENDGALQRGSAVDSAGRHLAVQSGRDSEAASYNAAASRAR